LLSKILPHFITVGYSTITPGYGKFFWHNTRAVVVMNISGTNAYYSTHLNNLKSSCFSSFPSLSYIIHKKEAFW